MNTIQEKEALVMALLPLLNQMAQSEAVKFLAEKKEEITFADLMALSEAELEALQRLVNSTKAANKSKRDAKLYESVKPAYVITDEAEKVKHKIIC